LPKKAETVAKMEYRLEIEFTDKTMKCLHNNNQFIDETGVSQMDKMHIEEVARKNAVITIL